MGGGALGISGLCFPALVSGKFPDLRGCETFPMVPENSFIGFSAFIKAKITASLTSQEGLLIPLFIK